MEVLLLKPKEICKNRTCLNYFIAWGSDLTSRNSSKTTRERSNINVGQTSPQYVAGEKGKIAPLFSNYFILFQEQSIHTYKIIPLYVSH